MHCSKMPHDQGEPWLYCVPVASVTMLTLTGCPLLITKTRAYRTLRETSWQAVLPARAGVLIIFLTIDRSK